MNNGNLIYERNRLTLRYTHGNKCDLSLENRESTLIHFYCNLTGDIIGSGPIFIQRWPNCMHEFRWYTSAACSSAQLYHCQMSITDQNTGKQYDLSSLVKSNGGWLAVNAKSPSNQIYYINVCRSVQGVMGCPNSSKSCLIINQQGKNKSRIFHNLGRISKGIKIENGLLSLFYTHGDICSDGSSRKTTRIMFTCKYGVKNAPVFISHENHCHYYFLWIHEAACPVQSAAGENCRIKNPLSGHIFNLNSLYNPNQDYIVTDRKGHAFNINVCGPLNVNYCSNQSANCQFYQTNHTLRYNCGRVNKILYYHAGQLFFNYSDGDLCHGLHHRSTIITFICSPNITIGRPIFINESRQCVYSFIWPTKLACEEQTECLATNPNGSMVDLSPLTRNQGGWKVYNVQNSIGIDKKIYINICKALNPVENLRCPAGSAACAILPRSNLTVNLGGFDHPAKIDPDGSIILRYAQGSPCSADTSRNRSTLIIFTCRMGSIGYPVLDLNRSDSCQDTIWWRTNRACTSKQSKWNSCWIHNAITNSMYNLSRLNQFSESHYVIQSSYGLIYLRICDTVQNLALSKSECAGASVCLAQNGSSLSLGSVDSSLLTILDRDILTLQYFNGSVCSKNSSQRISTTIILICDKNGGNGKPILITQDDDSCEFNFIWKTKYACSLHYQNECTIRNRNGQFDLSPFSLMGSDWKWVDAKGNRYWLNLCDPIRNRPQGCLPSAAICMQDRNEINTETLGLTWSRNFSPSNRDQSVVTVSYAFGAPLCQRRNQSATTAIHFSCDSRISKPKLLQFDMTKCRAQFLWPSILACKRQHGPLPDNDCIITVDQQTGIFFNANDFALPSNNWNITVTTNYGKNSTLFINVCKNLNALNRNSSCVDSSACIVESDGIHHQIGSSTMHREFYMRNHNILEMILPTKHRCRPGTNKTITTVIFFRCDPDQYLGQPNFVYESQDCKYILVWPTLLACYFSEIKNLNGTVITATDNTTGISRDQARNHVTIIVIVVSAFIICTLSTRLLVFWRNNRKNVLFMR
ncbi:uncharacterized protein TRIADDRAFT_60938 [Trichoplax adhaerens]|uniref:MRH domain-containing protein n=1 Tax=Trichoplax adhaerens TaxID=10228 RepID=B3S9K3_TRIAD|nr:hypothetical protein TRIADDRAFT_60938 [Trichoplax adhaerens]EDV20551.1 hypothetical protein TRIADDRAFT_60938 [Trichoplax adhaerens]|eukprot:XP_002116977.1 hypothetical protein TRIADDRAFT_60938 [Trichoplax adhaerens]